MIFILIHQLDKYTREFFTISRFRTNHTDGGNLNTSPRLGQLRFK